MRVVDKARALKVNVRVFVVPLGKPVKKNTGWFSTVSCLEHKSCPFEGVAELKRALQ